MFTKPKLYLKTKLLVKYLFSKLQAKILNGKILEAKVPLVFVLFGTLPASEKGLLPKDDYFRKLSHFEKKKFSNSGF